MDVNEADMNDQCAGHTDVAGVYHYRTTPGDSDAQNHFKTRNTDFSYCTELSAFVKSDDESRHSPLIGFALDGIPLYGPRDVDGKLPTDLDACNGHTDIEHPFYHYHTTSNYPYTVGCFRGCVDDVVNGAFTGSTCTQMTDSGGMAVAYDYSSITHVHSPTAESYGLQLGANAGLTNTDLNVTATSGTDSLGAYITEFAGANPVNVVEVPAGQSITDVVTRWTINTIKEHGYMVTADPTKGTNLLAYIDSAYPGGDHKQNYGRVIITSNGVQTGSALNVLIPQGKTWGTFEESTNVVHLFFSEINHNLAARFVDAAVHGTVTTR